SGSGCRRRWRPSSTGSRSDSPTSPSSSWRRTPSGWPRPPPRPRPPPPPSRRPRPRRPRRSSTRPADAVSTRAELPKLTDRLPLGGSGLEVSPCSLGLTGDPATVPAAFEAGINFFFLTADMHWPIYEPTRRGLKLLLEGRPGVRDAIVV